MSPVAVVAAVVDTIIDTVPPADDRIYGPEAFGVGWLLGGVAAIAAGVALAVWALRGTRPRAVRPAPRPVLGLQARYLDRLDELDHRLRHDELDARQLHHELSRTLRDFVAEAGTAGAPAMSAEAIEAAGQRPAATALRSYEVPQFDLYPDSDPAASVARAKAVVSGWRGP